MTRCFWPELTRTDRANSLEIRAGNFGIIPFLGATIARLPLTDATRRRVGAAFGKVGKMNDTENRGMADFGRSMLKQVANMSKREEGLVDAVGSPAPVAQIVTVPVVKPAAPQPANDVTVISPNVQLTGTIVTPDELHVAGKVHGNLAATAITIRSSGVVTGDVAADVLIVHGRIEGRIFAKTVKLCAGATVIGDIVAGQLGIDTDAVFEGASKRSPDALAEGPEFAKAA